MITRYKDFSNFGNEPLMEKEEYFANIDSIQNRIDTMILEGKSKEEINEDLSSIFNTLGGGFKQTVYQYAAEWLLEKLHLPIKDANGKTYWIVKLATQIVSKINFLKITSYFGEGSCKNWIQAIEEGLVGFINIELGSLIAESLGMKPEAARSGILNTTINTFSNTLTEIINSSEFGSNLEKSISGKICGEGAPGFSDIFKGKTLNPEKKKEFTQNINMASKEDPDIMDQVRGLDLGKILGWGGNKI